MYRIKRTSDPELIATMQSECLPGAPKYEVDGSTWWVVDHGSGIVGFAGYSPSMQWKNTIYLCRAGVVLDHRGHGLHKKLIRVRLKHAKANGMEWAVTDTRHNPASANGLIACGFRMYIPQNPWSFKDACYWIRKL